MIWSRIRKQKRIEETHAFQEIVGAYSSVISLEPRGVGGSISVDKLPYSKPEIKAALVADAFAIDTDNSRFEALGIVYMELSAFQVWGGGDSVFAFGDLEDNMSPESVKEIDRKVAEYGDTELRLMRTILEESLELCREWNELTRRRKLSDA